jgi:hypothetical protein
MRAASALIIAVLAGAAHAQVPPPAPLEATTTGGDKVRLFPDGRWEYVDPAKRAPAPATAVQPAAQNAQPSCPPGWQGGLFGFGRCIPPGDPQYNRGSLGRGK